MNSPKQHSPQHAGNGHPTFYEIIIRYFFTKHAPLGESSYSSIVQSKRKRKTWSGRWKQSSVRTIKSNESLIRQCGIMRYIGIAIIMEIIVKSNWINDVLSLITGRCP